MNKVEIERKYLLDRLPVLPCSAECWIIDQGYFADGASSIQLANGEMKPVGRIRRARLPDGRIICTHTIKTGMGLVRQEEECTIEQEHFERWWPHTKGCRLRKYRYCVCENGSVWEVDQFADTDLVLAEIELPSSNSPVQMPAWLAPCVVREVTDEAEYTNASIAKRLSHSPQKQQ